jgi:hypothetical protein
MILESRSSFVGMGITNIKILYHLLLEKSFEVSEKWGRSRETIF